MAKQAALKFVVFLGTVRENNFGSRVAKYIVRKLEEKGHSVTLLGEVILILIAWTVGDSHPKCVCARTRKITWVI